VPDPPEALNAIAVPAVPVKTELDIVSGACAKSAGATTEVFVIAVSAVLNVSDVFELNLGPYIPIRPV
jgi:hypothetical protein